MKNNKYYFGLGFISAFMMIMLLNSCSEPLNANICEPGTQEWCPLYVKVVE